MLVTDDQPPISETTALLFAAFLTLLFVAPFYLSPTLRATPLNRRDSPTNIRARVRAVGVVCLVGGATTVAYLHFACRASLSAILHLTGVYPFDPLDIPRGLLLVVILFVGPLYESLYIDSGWRDLSLQSFKWHWWDTWTGLRNHTVAPAGEEFVFRALVISVYLCTGASGARVVFRSPLVFGIAHVHHLVEFLQHHTPRGRRWPGAGVVLMGLARSGFQFAYTSLFGFFAAFVFLRTGSVLTAIAAHSFCNFMGFPRVTGRVGQFAHDETGAGVPDVAQAKPAGGGAVGDGHGPKNLGLEWTIAYYILLIVGAVGFYQCLWPLTESRNALTTF